MSARLRIFSDECAQIVGLGPGLGPMYLRLVLLGNEGIAAVARAMTFVLHLGTRMGHLYPMTPEKRPFIGLILGMKRPNSPSW